MAYRTVWPSSEPYDTTPTSSNYNADPLSGDYAGSGSLSDGAEDTSVGFSAGATDGTPRGVSSTCIAVDFDPLPSGISVESEFASTATITVPEAPPDSDGAYNYANGAWVSIWSLDRSTQLTQNIRVWSGTVDGGIGTISAPILSPRTQISPAEYFINDDAALELMTTEGFSVIFNTQADSRYDVREVFRLYEFGLLFDLASSNPLRRYPRAGATGATRVWPRTITRRPGTY